MGRTTVQQELARGIPVDELHMDGVRLAQPTEFGQPVQGYLHGGQDTVGERCRYVGNLNASIVLTLLLGETALNGNTDPEET